MVKNSVVPFLLFCVSRCGQLATGRLSKVTAEPTAFPAALCEVGMPPKRRYRSYLEPGSSSAKVPRQTIWSRRQIKLAATDESVSTFLLSVS